jgi:uncharacterized CHY-type Zn-finger protein
LTFRRSSACYKNCPKSDLLVIIDHKGAIKMKSCVRCGNNLQHNYLVTVFKETKEKRERLIVCFKCRDILTKEAPKVQHA